MPAIEIIFWVSFSLLFFCYLGYGILLFFINHIKKLFFYSGNKFFRNEFSSVTLIVSSYNEAEVLESKIKNSLTINYPPDLLEIVFVVDGSSDHSVEIIKKFPSVKLIVHKERKGKLAAIKSAMSDVKNPVVVFSDANTILNKDCIHHITKHYTDKKVGGVSGEKKILANKRFSAIGWAESLYWKYESFMKKQDSDFNTVIGAAGELFSIRTDLFDKIGDNLILDDFIISMKICLRGFKIKYEPGAYASEAASSSLKDEAKRKIRISAGAFQSIGHLRDALNFFKHPLLTFQYFFRRLFRWTLCPLLLVVFFVSNIILVIMNAEDSFYYLSLGFQALFYILAMFGWIIVRSARSSGLLNIPFYFVFMNYCLVRGFITFIRGRQTVLWDKSSREIIS